jgi:hypothetical protein
MAAALKKLSFFGSVLQFLNKKDEKQVQSARSAKISSYEDEIKLLLDAGAPCFVRSGRLLLIQTSFPPCLAELALPACVADGITLIISQPDALAVRLLSIVSRLWRFVSGFFVPSSHSRQF